MFSSKDRKVRTGLKVFSPAFAGVASFARRFS